MYYLIAKVKLGNNLLRIKKLLKRFTTETCRLLLYFNKFIIITVTINAPVYLETFIMLTFKKIVLFFFYQN